MQLSFFFLVLIPIDQTPMNDGPFFRFQKKETSYVEEYKSITYEDLEDGTTKHTVVFAQTNNDVQRMNNYFLYLVTISKIEYLKNGEKQKNPFIEALLGSTFTYHVDLTGKVLALYGFDEVRRKMKEIDPATPFPDTNALIETEMLDWNQRYQDLVEAPLKPSQCWENLTTANQVELEQPLHQISKIVQAPAQAEQGWVECRFRYQTGGFNRAPSTCDFSVQGINASLASWKEHRQPSIFGEGKRVIDTHTMLIKSESHFQIRVLGTAESRPHRASPLLYKNAKFYRITYLD